MSEERSAVDRVLGAIVPRAVGAVDADALISDIDVDAVVARIDLDALVARLDVDALIQRPALVGRERRALHDLGSGSKELGDWGTRDAALPSPLGRWLELHAPDAAAIGDAPGGAVADEVSVPAG